MDKTLFYTVLFATIITVFPLLCWGVLHTTVTLWKNKTEVVNFFFNYFKGSPSTMLSLLFGVWFFSSCTAVLCKTFNYYMTIYSVGAIGLSIIPLTLFYVGFHYGVRKLWSNKRDRIILPSAKTISKTTKFV